MILPSKELLRVVLNETVLRLGSFNNPIIEVEFQRYSYREWLKINIHELQARMKEWALKQNHCFYSGIGEDECVCFIDFFEGNLTDSLFYETYLTAPTEFEAVCKATQYVYDNLSSK